MQVERKIRNSGLLCMGRNREEGPYFLKRGNIKHHIWKAQLNWEKAKVIKITWRIENWINSEVGPCKSLQEPFALEKLSEIREQHNN